VDSGRKFPGIVKKEAASFFVSGHTIFRQNAGKFVPEYTAFYLKNTVISLQIYIPTDPLGCRLLTLTGVNSFLLAVLNR